MAYGAILGQRGIQSVNGVPSGVTGNVDLSAGNMTSGIDMNSQTLTGLTTPINNNDATSKKYVDDNINLASTTGLEAIRAAAPYNWLDNSDFTNLVAQAGIGEKHGTSQTYAADRWVLNNGTVSYNAGTGLTLNGTIGQKIENPPTGNTSTFVGTSSGTATISFIDGWVYISSSGGVIAWAALYEGTYTEQTKPEYRPKGYAVEFAECQRFYRRLSYPETNQVVFFMFARNEISMIYMLDVSGMRILEPTVNISISAKALMGSETIDPVTIEVTSYYPGLARLTARVRACTAGAAYMIVTTSTGSYIEVSADV